MAGNTGETETRVGSGGYGSHSTLARRAQNVILMGGASGNAGSPGTSRLGHLSQQGIWGQKPAGHSHRKRTYQMVSFFSCGPNRGFSWAKMAMSQKR